MSTEQWLVLRLDLLPSIAQEVEQICTNYIHLCDEVRKGNKQAYQDLIVLQARIRGRMDDFDKFYDRNYADYRIGYFEKMKLRLRKLISPHIDVTFKFNSFSRKKQQNNQYPLKNEIKLSIIDQFMRKLKIIINNHLLSRIQLKINKVQMIKQNYKMFNDFSQVFLLNRIITNNQIENQQFNLYNTSTCQGYITEFVQAQPKRPQSPPNKMTASSNYNSTNKQKQATPIAQNNNKKASKQPQQVKTSQAKAKTQQDELVFTIKMSKEEYLQYIQAKQKQR